MKSKLVNRLIVIILLLSTLLILTGCGNEDNENKKSNNDSKTENSKVENINQNEKDDEKNVTRPVENDIFFDVLDNKVPFINEYGEETYFNDYMKQFEERGKSTVSYAFIDMDANGNEDDEMVVFVKNSDGFYLILNYEKGKMYGFEEPFRGMSSLKKDGIHWASGGAEYTQIIRKKFVNDGSRIENIVLAENDGGKYYIDGKGVSQKDYVEYIENFHQKEEVEFIKYKEFFDNTNNGTNSAATNIQNISSDFKEGKYVQTMPSKVGTEAEGYDTTLTLNGGKAAYFESYWESEMYGTYSVQGNTLTITYTSGVEVNSITGKQSNQSMNVVQVYEISGNTIKMKSTTDDSYYTAGSVVYELR